MDRPLNEKERHGIDVAATIKKLRLTKEGEVDLYGSEENKTVELVLYDDIAFSGGWDSDTLCGLPESQGISCGTEQNGTVAVQGMKLKYIYIFFLNTSNLIFLILSLRFSVS
jgi:hypothetical protein